MLVKARPFFPSPETGLPQQPQGTLGGFTPQLYIQGFSKAHRDMALRAKI